jgi:CheY-like chemotaxis protein
MEGEDVTYVGPPPGRGDDDKVTNELSETSLPETGETSPRDFLVLVADDEVDHAVMLSMDLQGEGYRVVTASDGEQAVRVASQVKPDIILMDIGMPGLDGLGAARRIREAEATKGVPIIAVTAFGTGGFQHAARDAGIDGYLTKPLDFQLLHELMRRLLPVKS